MEIMSVINVLKNVILTFLSPFLLIIYATYVLIFQHNKDKSDRIKEELFDGNDIPIRDANIEHIRRNS